MKKNYYLDKLYNSNKPFIIYKVERGYDLFTDFSEKIVLNNKNINNFFHKINKLKKKNKFLNLYIGFFGYEILCNLNNVRIPKQKNLKFSKGIFYKPETKIQIRKNITIKSTWCPSPPPRAPPAEQEWPKGCQIPLSCHPVPDIA